MSSLKICRTGDALLLVLGKSAHVESLDNVLVVPEEEQHTGVSRSFACLLL